MSYSLSLTNGTPVITLGNNIIDTTTLSVNLLGQNATGYGLYLNENFIKMLENFSYSTAPSAPLKGQLWWDSTNKILKIYDGALWKQISSSTASPVAPTTNPIIGDLWWDTTNGQLKSYNGSIWITVGPTTPSVSSPTFFAGALVSDNLSITHSVGNIIVSNKLAAVISTDAAPFTPIAPIGGLPVINPGMNFPSSVEATMITSPNIAIGSITGNLYFASNIAGNITTVLSTNGNTGLMTVIGNPTNNLGIATKIYVDTANVAMKSYVDTANTAVTNYSTTYTNTANVSMKSYVDDKFSPTNSISTFAASLVPTANLTYNLGSTSAWWNNIYGTAIHARYADLAERFEADAPMVPGTVVELGGEAEITSADQDLSEKVFGVISTNAAYLMNSGAGTDTTHPPVAVQGRVPVRVIGQIRKGDRLVSAGNGMARAGARNEISAWNVIGRALENKLSDGEGVIEAIVKLNS